MIEGGDPIKNNNSNIDLNVDEEIEIDDIKLERSRVPGHPMYDGPGPSQPRKKIRRSTIVGVLLVFVFLLNLFFPINFYLVIRDIENATGDTILSGQVKDVDDDPVENMTVTIHDTNLTAFTDNKGRYRFEKVPVGEYEIEYSKEGYRRVIVHKTLFSKKLLERTDESQNIIDLPGNLMMTRIYLSPLDGPYNETVIVDDNLNGTLQGSVMNTSGALLDNIEVSVVSANISTQTDNSGNYTLHDIPPGIIALRVKSPRSDNITMVKILFASNSSTELNIVYDEGLDQSFDEVSGQTQTINGSVVDSKRRTVENATVKLIIENNVYPNNVKYSANDGYFEFTNVPVGLYEITVFAKDFYFTYLNNVTVRNSSVTDLEAIELKKIESPAITITEDISSSYTYSCIVILVLLTLITLFGAIGAFQQKRYSVAFIGAIVGMVPVVLNISLDICVASVFSLFALVMIVFSKGEFKS